MLAALKAGRTTSHEIVQQYLTRIATYEDTLHAALTVNPHALEEADQRDRERAAGTIRGPLHGIPIALKDNIHTTNMPTTGGALAFVGLVPPYEATLTKNLEDAGAIIIAKTGLTELANYVAANMPTNYNAVGGYGFNPYDPRRDPRTTADGRPIMQTGGSSSGDRHRGQLLGRQCRDRDVGIDPQSVEPEHAGCGQADGRPDQPLRRDSDHRRPGHPRTDGEARDGRRDHARSAREQESRSERSRDQDVHAAGRQRLRAPAEAGRAQRRADRHSPSRFLRSGSRPEWRSAARGGLNPAQAKVMEEAIAALKSAGAIVVDVEIPSVTAKDPKENLFLAGNSIVLNYGMKRDFNNWLRRSEPLPRSSR